MASFLRKIFGQAASASLVNENLLAELGVDMHSHLLPGLDDGAETIEQSLGLLEAMQALGFRKLIMTPHIMGDFYKNTSTTVHAALARMQEAATTAGFTDIQL